MIVAADPGVILHSFRQRCILLIRRYGGRVGFYPEAALGVLVQLRWQNGCPLGEEPVSASSCPAALV